MADDLLSKFTEKFRAKPPGSSPASGPTLPPELTPPHSPRARQAYEAYAGYEAIENQVRTSNVEIRCHRSGLAYYFDYAHITVPVFKFETGEAIYFTGGGHAVVIQGRNLGRIMLALRLKSCSTIQDFSAEKFILPEPVDHSAPFVESISVEILHGNGERDAGRSV